MSRFRETFSSRHVILPVIHVAEAEQALRNAEIARRQGCDGVFLIRHEIDYAELLRVHHQLFEAFPDWWLGVNCLDLSPSEVFDVITDEVAGVWVDDATIDERETQQLRAKEIQAARVKSGWQGLYFGGVAFKYQRHVEDVGRAAWLAAEYVDVVTTSGPATGASADRDKIQTMKEALGDFPLGIASGITPENVGAYLAIADSFLVATGISTSWLEFDEERVRDLVTKIRAYREPSRGGIMKSYRKELWFNLPNRRGFINITPQVEDCLRESGIGEGLCLVNAMHITAAVFINDDEGGLHADYEKWLEGLAPHAPTSQYQHNRTGEDNADAHLKRQIMGREVVVAVTNGRLDFGTWEQIFYGEFDGRRRKRVLVKVIGE